MRGPFSVSFQSPLESDMFKMSCSVPFPKPELLFPTTAGQCCTSLCCRGCALHPKCSLLLLVLKRGGMNGLLVSISRFPHAAELGSVWIQREDGLPAQAWCSASQWQEVWPLLWQDRHRCGEHIDHKGRLTALLLLCFPSLWCVRHRVPSIYAIVLQKENSFIRH